MIKSPCKDCEKHEFEFPTCFEACEIIKIAQRLSATSPPLIREALNYIVTHENSFPKPIRKYKAQE